jgi:uncharacterized membrane protein
MAADLLAPTFVMSMAEAVSRRLRRNYIWIFLILLGAWALKVTFPSFSGEVPPALSFHDWVRHAGVGPVSGWIISAIMLGFYGWIVVAALRTHDHGGELAHGNAHV